MRPEEVLVSERLELRPFTMADSAELLRLFAEPAVRRYLLDDRLVDAQWVREEIESSFERFEEGSCGLWSIRKSRESEIVGFVGFRPFFDPPELQLAFGLRPDRWGEGIATESATLVCTWAFERLDLDEVRAATDRPNAASIRVLERLGMRQVRTTEDGQLGTVFYSIDRRSWPPEDTWDSAAVGA